jgi:hypothetical protein
MKTILNHKKKKTYRLMIILSIVCYMVFFKGCTKEVTGDEPTLSKNYIQSFVLCDSITFGIDDRSNNLYIVFLGERIDSHDNRFQSLIEHFGDTAYNKELTSMFMFQQAVADEFISIDLISDRDFDALHPAGESLRNIMKFHGASPYKYITSGYTDEFDWNGNDIPEGFDVFLVDSPPNGYHPVYKLLPALAVDDLKLLGKWAGISFTVKPPLGEHNFTLTVKTATREFKSMEKVVFN